MSFEQELRKLDGLIHQFETVHQTTRDERQKERVAKQLKELRSAREKILQDNEIDIEAVRQNGRMEEFKHLRRLLDSESRRPEAERVGPLSNQEEVFNLLLYARFFKNEFLPFLVEKRLKLDYKFSQIRKDFYSRFNEVVRELEDFRRENDRLSNDALGREIELEARRRVEKLKRQVKVIAAKFFRAIQSFCEELAADADAERVKCLNSDEEIVFEDIEGKHLLEGRAVRDALGLLLGLASEVLAYLRVPGE